MLSDLSERTAYGVSRLRKDFMKTAVYGGSGLCEYCMKTIPELYVEEMTEMIHFQALPCSHVTGYEVIFYKN